MLEIKNLHVKLEDEDKQILKGLDLTVETGKVHAIMGPNGSGKSTLSYVLSGRDGYEVTDGSATMDGFDLLEAETEEARRTREWLASVVEELDALAPQVGEAEILTETRTRLMQSERVSEAVAEAEEAIADADIESALSKAARAAERICRLPGFDGADHPLAHAARSAADALERALIETGEAEAAIAVLESLIEHDTTALEASEARLFALRAVARKHSVEADLLPDVAETLRARLNLVEAGEDALIRARKAEHVANAAWHAAADKLTAARMAAATQLEKAIAKELAPLKLGRAVIRVSVSPLGEEGGPNGADHVEFDAETNPGAGFGPLRKIASGGELARVSLALKCALAEAGSAGTLIFDEADQGVGGHVLGARAQHVRVGRDLLVSHGLGIA